MSKRPSKRFGSIALIFFSIWATLSIIIFIGMRNYPELPGQKVPKPWMLSVFLFFLVCSWLWVHIFFGNIYHSIRIRIATWLNIKSKVSEGSAVSGVLTESSGADQWEAEADAPVVRSLIFYLIEYAVVILGIVIPVTAIITTGVFVTAYLSDQL